MSNHSLETLTVLSILHSFIINKANAPVTNAFHFINTKINSIIFLGFYETVEKKRFLLASFRNAMFFISSHVDYRAHIFFVLSVISSRPSLVAPFFYVGIQFAMLFVCGAVQGSIKAASAQNAHCE